MSSSDALHSSLWDRISQWTWSSASGWTVASRFGAAPVSTSALHSFTSMLHMLLCLALHRSYDSTRHASFNNWALSLPFKIIRIGFKISVCSSSCSLTRNPFPLPPRFWIVLYHFNGSFLVFLTGRIKDVFNHLKNFFFFNKVCSFLPETMKASPIKHIQHWITVLKM